MNAKISEVENKIHDVNGLVKKAGYDAKILVIEKKYFTTFDYNKLTEKKKKKKTWCKDKTKEISWSIWYF